MPNGSPTNNPNPYVRSTVVLRNAIAKPKSKESTIASAALPRLPSGAESSRMDLPRAAAISPGIHSSFFGNAQSAAKKARFTYGMKNKIARQMGIPTLRNRQTVSPTPNQINGIATATIVPAKEASGAGSEESRAAYVIGCQ